MGFSAPNLEAASKAKATASTAHRLIRAQGRFIPRQQPSPLLPKPRLGRLWVREGARTRGNSVNLRSPSPCPSYYRRKPEAGPAGGGSWHELLHH